MTTLDADVTVARRIKVRLVFGYLGEMDDVEGNPYPLSIGSAASHLQGIEDLLLLAAVEDWHSEPDNTSLDSPANFVRNVLVKRISYASPLEVIVSFIAGTGAATLAVSRLIRVWDNWILARSHSDSLRRQGKGTELFVAAADVLQATIDAPIPISPNTPEYDRFKAASEVLALLSSLEIEEEA